MLHSSGFGARSWRWLILVFGIAALVRVGWVTVRFSGDQPGGLAFPDERTYCSAARSLAAGDGLVYESGFRAAYMPGYPAFIALFDRLPRPLFWARVAQALLGAWVAPATFLLARRWAILARLPRPGPQGPRGEATWIAVLAGLAVAFDPFLVFFAGLLLTETLFAAALVTAWVFLLPMCQEGARIRAGHVLATGVMLGACVMLRPSAVVLVILVPVALALWRRFDRPGVVAGVVILEVVVIALIPWAGRNRAVTGEWRWLTSRGGISLYDGLQARPTGGASDLAATKDDPYAAMLHEWEWDRYWRSRAWSDAGRDWPRLVVRAGQKFLRTWSLTPNAEPYQRGPEAIVSAVWMVIVLASATAGGWRHRRAVRWWVILLLPVAAVTLLHTIMVGSVRYRVPFMPMVCVLSAAGLAPVVAALWQRHTARRGQGGADS